MPSHLPTVAVWLLISLALTALGYRWRDTPAEKRLRNGIAAFALLAWLGTQTWYALDFQAYESLPLHVCDLAGLIAPLALWSRNRVLRAMLYFWGIGLSTQGFLTPVVTVGPGHVEYWLFWSSHTAIIGGAIYDFGAGGFRPGRSDFWTAVVISIPYVLLMMILNKAQGWNYGYVGDVTPDVPTVLDLLGPWPWRVLWLSMIVAVWYVILWQVGARIPTGASRPVESAGEAEPAQR